MITNLHNQELAQNKNKGVRRTTGTGVVLLLLNLISELIMYAYLLKLF